MAEGARPRGGDVVVSRRVEDSPEPVRLGGIGIKLGQDIEDRTGLETRTTVLGHLQRGGTPTAYDRILATRFGVAAAERVAAGHWNQMVALAGNAMVSVPIEKISGKTRTVPLDAPLIRAARAVGTILGNRTA